MSQRFVPVSDFNKARELYHAGLLWWLKREIPATTEWPFVFSINQEGWPNDNSCWPKSFGILIED